MDTFFQICEWIGTIAFAVSGAMIAVDKKMDLFGVLFLSAISALGGGILRDLIIGCFPPRMFLNYSYLSTACISALCVFVIAWKCKESYVKREVKIEQINNIFDAVGLGLFAVSGARIGMEAGYGENLFLMVFLGTMTGIGGGIIRDVLIGEIPLVFKKHIYAVAAILGALCYVVMCRIQISSTFCYLTGMAVTVVVRLLATYFKWNLPVAIK